jgi:hypothetical protein
MMLKDLDDRLIAINDTASSGFVLDEGQWKAISSAFARKAWLDGETLSEAEAKSRFKGAKLDELPELK